MSAISKQLDEGYRPSFDFDKCTNERNLSRRFRMVILYLVDIIYCNSEPNPNPGPDPSYTPTLY